MKPSKKKNIAEKGNSKIDTYFKPALPKEKVIVKRKLENDENANSQDENKRATPSPPSSQKREPLKLTLQPMIRKFGGENGGLKPKEFGGNLKGKGRENAGIRTFGRENGAASSSGSKSFDFRQPLKEIPIKPIKNTLKLTSAAIKPNTPTFSVLCDQDIQGSSEPNEIDTQYIPECDTLDTQFTDVTASSPINVYIDDGEENDGEEATISVYKDEPEEIISVYKEILSVYRDEAQETISVYRDEPEEILLVYRDQPEEILSVYRDEPDRIPLQENKDVLTPALPASSMKKQVSFSRYLDNNNTVKQEKKKDEFKSFFDGDDRKLFGKDTNEEDESGSTAGSGLFFDEDKDETGLVDDLLNGEFSYAGVATQEPFTITPEEYTEPVKCFHHPFPLFKKYDMKEEEEDRSKA